MKTSYAWRVYWKYRGQTWARSEQFAKKRYARKYAKTFLAPHPLKVEIKKEKKSKFQKKEEKMIKKAKLKGMDRYRGELAIPY